MSELKFNIGDRIKWTCPQKDKPLYDRELKGLSFTGTIIAIDKGFSHYHIAFDKSTDYFHGDSKNCYWVYDQDIYSIERLEINSDNSDTIFTKAKNIIRAEGEKAAAAEREKVYQEKLKATKFKFKPGDFVIVVDSGYSYPNYDSWHGFAEAGRSNKRFRPDIREGNIYKVVHCSSWTKEDFTKKLVLLVDGYGNLYIIGEQGCTLA